MPRYYLDVHEAGKTVAIDPEGAEFPSLETARLEAIEAARQLAANRALTGVIPVVGSFIEIAMEGSEVSLVVPFEEAFHA